MDTLRGVLMAFGVVLHAALVYDTGRRWIVSDPAGNTLFGMGVTLIHLYRMPVFFLVSGFFTALLYAKYPPPDFYAAA